MVVSFLIITVAALFGVVADNGSDKPLALQKAIEARAALQTARVEYSVTRTNGRDKTPVGTRFYSWSAGGGDFMLVDRGSEPGVYARQPGGEPAPVAFNKPRRYLVKDGRVWNHIDDATTAHVFAEQQGRKAFDVHDLRELGLNPVSVGPNFDEVLSRGDMPPLKYEERSVGELRLVTGSNKVGEVRWWIDPTRDWNVVRTDAFSDGKLIGRFDFELALDEADGVWFPKRITHTRLAAGDTEPSNVIKLLSVEFNRPEHPLTLSPKDIGVEPGMTVVFQDTQPGRNGLWDGTDAVSLDQFRAAMQAGNVTPGATVVREYARRAALDDRARIAAASQPAGVTIVEVPDSAWEAYTRGVIERFRFDDDQTQRAWSICRECQDSARRIIAIARPQLDLLREESLESNPSDWKRVKALRIEWTARRERLLQQVREIFERELKPRLDKLPTRAQRARAEQARTGKPERP